MKNFEPIYDTIIMGARSRPQPPPTPHEPYEYPDGALYIGYVTEGKEFLYSQEELEMFQNLRGVYVGIPDDDPYNAVGAKGITVDVNIDSDPKDNKNFTDRNYVLASRNSSYTSKPNFNQFDNYAVSKAKISSESADSPNAIRTSAINQIQILDLISEGEIEGLVDKTYNYEAGSPGQIGYSSVTEEAYPSVLLNGKSYNYLQSIYYNGIPLVDQDGKFNFQQIDIRISNGTPQGDDDGVPVSIFGKIPNITDQPLQVSRRIGEVLRGPNSRAGVSAGSKEKTPGFFSKFYKILNTNCNGVKIFIRLDGASERRMTGPRYEPVTKGEGFGDTIPIQIAFGASFRRIFSNRPPEAYSKPFNFFIIVKASTSFLYEFRLPFYKTQLDLNDPEFLGFEIKITRYTPDSTSTSVRNRTTIDSIVEIYDQKFTYPNSAILYSKFIAEYFQQVPERACDVRLLKIKVPSNYNPLTKTYTGDWDGTFKANKAWSDNPAWCYYDLLTNKRYGLGDYINEDDIDKWTIYELGQYCDQMVSDGEGGYEPRYVCNAYLKEKSDAINAVKNFTSIFRGFSYFMGGVISLTFDAKKDPIYTFTNANVKGGSFSYQGSPADNRANVILVRYNDQNNFYEPAIEYMEDPISIKRNGIIQKEINAFGCTKKSYALRYAQWIKETENTELETVSFAGGLECMALRPGDVINISDRNRYGKRYGGKITDIGNSGSSAYVTLDSKINFSGDINYIFNLLTPTFNFETSLITTGIATTGNNIFVSTGLSGGLSSHFISGIRKPHLQNKTFTSTNVVTVTGYDNLEKTRINFNSNFNETGFSVSGIYPFYIYSNDTGDLIDNKLYRIINIKEDDRNEYSISALEVNQNKYDVIDSGAAVITTSALPNKPESITLNSTEILSDDNQFISAIGYSIEKPANTANLKNYIVYAKNGDWVGSDFARNVVDDSPPSPNYAINTIYPISPIQDIDEKFLIPAENGTYFFRVYTRNAKGQVCSVPASGELFYAQSNRLIGLVSVNSLKQSQASDVFFASAFLASNDQDQKREDLIADFNPAGTKLLINGNENSAYGQGGVKELVTVSEEPEVTWQTSLPTFSNDDINFAPSDFSFRITAREPSPTSLPSKYIYFEITGVNNGYQGNTLQSALSNNTFTIGYVLNRSGTVRDASQSRIAGKYPEVLSYQFPTTEQLASSNRAFYLDFVEDQIIGSKGPFRNYDLVIEATDKDNYTSISKIGTSQNIISSEKISNGFWDLDQIRAEGYDILEIRNPKSLQTICTPDSKITQAKASIFPPDEPSILRTNGYFTNQIYNPEGKTSSIYQRSQDIDDNYATVMALGANVNAPTFCVTNQYFTLDGDLIIKILRDARGFAPDPYFMIDYRDASAIIVYYSDSWFNINNVKDQEALFEIDTFTDAQYNLPSYTEYKPKGAYITVENSSNFIPDGVNSTSYTTTVKAKVFDFRAGTSFLSENGQFTLPMGIANSKYVSFAFLDRFDYDKQNVLDAEDEGLELVQNSSKFNLSPAVLVNVKGEPSKKAGFRAYALIKATVATPNTTKVGGGSNLMDLIPYIDSSISSPVIYPIKNNGLENIYKYSRQEGWRYTYIATYGRHRSYTLYIPDKISIEAFLYGLDSSGIIVEGVQNSISPYQAGFILTFSLEEEVPTNNRIVNFTGKCADWPFEDVDNLTIKVLFYLAAYSLNISYRDIYERALNYFQDVYYSSQRETLEPSKEDFEEINRISNFIDSEGKTRYRYFYEGSFTLVSNGDNDGVNIAYITDLAKNITSNSQITNPPTISGNPLGNFENFKG